MRRLVPIALVLLGLLVWIALRPRPDSRAAAGSEPAAAPSARNPILEPKPSLASQDAALVPVSKDAGSGERQAASAPVAAEGHASCIILGRAIDEDGGAIV